MSATIAVFDFGSIALLVSGALLAGFFTGFAGFGTGLVASGFWFLALPATSVPPLIVLISVAGQLIGVTRLRQSLNWPGVAPYLAGGILGLPLGVATLQMASASALRTTVGFFLIVYAVAQLSGLLRRSIGSWGRKIADGAIGIGGGFLGGFAGLSGPLPLIWLQLRGGPRDRQRTTYQPFNLVILTAAAIAMMATGKIDKTVITATSYCLPATILGTSIGLRFYSKTGEAGFRRIVLGLLLISGTILVVQSATG